MTRTRIAKIIGSAALLIAVGSHFVQTTNKHTASASSSLPDNTNNIHVGLPFDSNTTPAGESGKVDYVFGSNYPNQPTSVYHTYYIPFDRDRDSSYVSQAHNYTWWKANH